VELRDLIVTPLVIIIVYAVAYMLRPYITDGVSRKYFLPALTVKIFGALAVGFIYQFYYQGGDTYNYHTHGSRHIWEAFMDDPMVGLKLLLNDGSDETGIYRYSSRILFFHDPQAYVIIRLAGFFDLFTFSAYSATAVLFAVVGFAGLWLLFDTFYRMHPSLHWWIAIAVLFIPSVIFWGSGLLKDTITLACIGAATYATYNLFVQRRLSIGSGILLLASIFFLYKIKIYILLTFLPAAIVWVFMLYFSRIRSSVLKIMVFPFVIVTASVLGYFAMLKAGEDNPKYALGNLAKTAQVTAYDIRYLTGRDAGSGYTLGDLDGTWQSMIRLAPQAINVSLFRPYLWEVRNPLMLLSAMESMGLFVLTLWAVYRSRSHLFKALGDPTILFCLVFSITFAFAVGVSTFNFGTLTRYKIPLMPYYSLALILLFYYSNRETKEEALEITE
jgi:hypothetical protein